MKRIFLAGLAAFSMVAIGASGNSLAASSSTTVNSQNFVLHGNGTLDQRVSAGSTVEVCTTPTVTTANGYGANYIIGAGAGNTALTFANAFTDTGSGIIQSVSVNLKKVETSGFTFIPFGGNPSNTTWTDASTATISVTDRSSVVGTSDAAMMRSPIGLSLTSPFGTHTNATATLLGQSISTGSTTLYGILIANATLTNNFTTTGDVTICVTVVQDP